MTLTPEQLEQCREKFEKFWAKESTSEARLFADSVCPLFSEKWKVALIFYDTWRPIPSVEEIEKIIKENVVCDYDCYRATYQAFGVPDAAQAIHHAFGGQDE